MRVKRGSNLMWRTTYSRKPNHRAQWSRTLKRSIPRLQIESQRWIGRPQELNVDSKHKHGTRAMPLTQPEYPQKPKGCKLDSGRDRASFPQEQSAAQTETAVNCARRAPIKNSQG